jgi:hypothetical protein
MSPFETGLPAYEAALCFGFSNFVVSYVLSRNERIVADCEKARGFWEKQGILGSKRTPALAFQQNRRDGDLRNHSTFCWHRDCSGV